MKAEKKEKMIKPGYVKPENIHVSEQHMGLRLFAVILLIVVAVSAFAYGIHSWLSVDEGWYEIEVGSGAETLESQEFYFYYHIGAGETGAYTEYRALITEYTNLVDEAYKLFSDESFDDCNNLYDLNNHMNETVTVDDALYDALRLLETYGSRYLYLAPVYATYESLYSCSYDEETANFDPEQNEVIAEYFSEVIAFANDPDAVNIELLGDNQVMLVVSEEYQAYAEGNGITEYVDFFLLANAFEIDYIANHLIADGYTAGTLSSYDGYTRTLGASGDDTASEGLEWSVSLTNRVGNTLYTACNMTYSGAASVVVFHDYPLYSRDELHYYSFSNGDIRTPYIDTSDGYCKSAIHDLAAISSTEGCAEMMIRLLPLYATDDFDRDAVQALSGIDSVIIGDGVISCTTDEVIFTDLYESDEITYWVE